MTTPSREEQLAALPLTPAEEVRWRAYVEAAQREHPMKGGMFDLAARLFATLDAVRADGSGGLDAAWAEAERALPKAGWLGADGRWVLPSSQWAITVSYVSSGDGYFEPYEEGYRATATMGPDLSVWGEIAADLPSAVLLLAARLRERASEPSEERG